MKYNATSVDEYVNALNEDRKSMIQDLRMTIKENLSEGFEEQFHYDMITYVVPLSLYPAGYHAKKGMPLPYISIASQKNTINVYHLGIYADEKLLSWYVLSYQKMFNRKPDMGKSCLRFKVIDDKQLQLIAQLAKKMSVQEYIELVENNKK